MKKYIFCLAVVLSLMIFSGPAITAFDDGLVGKYYAYVDLVHVGPGNVWSATYDDADLAFTRTDSNIHFYFGDINMPLCTGIGCPPYLYVSWSPIDQLLNDQYLSLGLCPDPDGFPYETQWKNDCYGVIWTGYIEIAETGWYSFATVSDDGASVRIDDDLIIDGHRNWFYPVAGSIYLEAGYHGIEVRYWEMTRWDGIRLEWFDDETGSWVTIPSEVFYHHEPCDPDADWKNHGQYVKCVVHDANQLFKLGVITKKEATAMKREAAQSDMGK